MARLSNTILGTKAYAQYANTPVNNVQVGAQMGYYTDYRGYVSNSAYVTRPMIAILIEAPRGFNDLDDSSTYFGTLKSLVEVQAKTIEGINGTINVEYVENAVGGAGEMQQDIAKVTRERSNPQFTWTEKYGRPINLFLTGWITMLIGDPITGVPSVRSLDSTGPTDLLPDYTGMTVMFIEPDPLHKYVQKACLCTNMMPKTAGDVTLSRDITQAGVSQDYSVEFTALTQWSDGVNEFAQRLLDQMNLKGVNPNLQDAFVSDIESDVTAQDDGYMDQINDADATFLDR